MFSCSMFMFSSAINSVGTEEDVETSLVPCNHTCSISCKKIRTCYEHLCTKLHSILKTNWDSVVKSAPFLLTQMTCLSNIDVSRIRILSKVLLKIDICRNHRLMFLTKHVTNVQACIFLKPIHAYKYALSIYILGDLMFKHQYLILFKRVQQLGCVRLILWYT